MESDWSEYDDKKKVTEDVNFFSCSEEWEMKYLLNKIKEECPEFEGSKMNTAISMCCMSIDAPRPREEFVSCVMKNLSVLS